MEICELITKENLNNIGFYLTGFGALYFFFIYSFLTKTTVITDTFWKYLTHNISINEFWLKNDNDESKGKYVELDENNIEIKTDWSCRKKFAFWSVDNGSRLSFFMVAFGFILQVIAKFL